MKYRQKDRPTPIVVDAWQQDGAPAASWPDWVKALDLDAVDDRLTIARGDGEVLDVPQGYWIVRWPNGDIHVHAPEGTAGEHPRLWFEAMYEPIGID